MIQIGKLRTWQPKGETKPRAFFKTIKGFNYPDLPTMFQRLEEDVPRFIPEEQERYNIFYTVAHHEEGQRVKSSWQYQDAIPFDLDGIDLERVNEYPKLLASTLGFDLSKCAITNSGNGIQILVMVETITDKDYINDRRKDYKQLLDKFKAACDEAKLPFTPDTTCWDYSRIFRAPFTYNFKIKENEQGEKIKVVKKAVLVQDTLELQNWTIPACEKVRKDHALKLGSFPRPDHNTVIKECNFFKWLKDSPDEVHEPHAYAMLSIAGHFNDDYAAARELWDSFSSPSINSKNFDEFLAQALRASGPRTCKGIEDISDKCATCPHYNQVTSPILLKDENYIGTEFMGFTTKSITGKSLTRHYEDLVKYFKREHHFKYLAQAGIFYVFNGKYYEEFHEARLKKFAQEKFLSPVKESERVEFVNACKAFNYTPVEWLQQKPQGLVNMNNGVLNIETGELLEHSPVFNFTYVLPYDYKPDATCTTWDNFLDDISLGREELKKILEEYLGYIVYGGEYRFHKALILSGSGRNGKSTFIDVLRALVGNCNMSNVTLTSMNTDSFASSDLIGRLANISEEEPPECFKETGVFKRLTGNNEIRVQKKFRDAFTILNRAKIVITYNKVPFISDRSIGMKERLLIVPFDFDLSKHPEKMNTNIKDELIAELSGIFNKVIEGYIRLKNQRGFTKSDLVKAAVKDALDASNPFATWFDETCEVSQDAEMVIGDAYQNYVEWMSENGERYPLGRKNFSLELKNMGFEIIIAKHNGKTKRIMRGVRLEASIAKHQF